jgi:MYXO-CTERM domain-containing protein
MRTLRLIALLGAGLAIHAPARADNPRSYRVVVQTNQVLPDGNMVRLAYEESIDENGDVICKLDTTLNSLTPTVWAELDGVLTLLASKGDVVGGVTVDYFLPNTPPAILRNGRALVKDMAGTLWKWDGSLQVVARPGEVVGGVAIGSIGESRLNSQGDVLFRDGDDNVWLEPQVGPIVRVAGPGLNFAADGLGCGVGLDDSGNVLLPLDTTDVLLAGQPGALVTLMQNGQPAPGGPPAANYFSFQDCGIAADTGIVTFASNITSPGFSQALFRGTFASIARIIDFPDGTNIHIGSRGLLTAGPGLVAFGMPHAVFVDAAGTMTTIATVGDPAPGLPGETIATLVVQDLNAVGQIVLSGTTSASKTAIWQFTPGKPIALIAAQGQMFDLGPPAGVVTATFVELYGAESGSGYAMQNDDGDIAFHISYSMNRSATLVSVSSLVVNSHGDLPQAGDPKACDTGLLATNGDPECTLRAAIQLANTRGKATRIRFDLPTTAPIVTMSPLPVVDVSIDIAGADGELVELQPATSAGSGDGLALGGSTSTLRNLAIRNFSGDGINATSDPLQLSGCDLTDNGGWGVNNDPGQVIIEPVLTHRSEVARNGKGGILAIGTDVPELMLTSADVHDNLGGGVVSNSEIDIFASKVLDNAGPGVAVLDGPGDIPGYGVHVAPGGDGSPTEISGNQGEGIYTFRGGVLVNTEASITGNGAWGVNASGVIYFGDFAVLPSYRITVSNNGAGSSCFDLGLDVSSVEHSSRPCSGGGLLSPHASTGSINYITNADIVDNAGPGVLAGDPITVALVTISRNAGPGVKRDSLLGGGIDNEEGVTVGFTSTISDNAGYGINSMLGYVAIDVASEIRGNHGAGIRTQTSLVTLDTVSAGANGRTVIAGNGSGTCTDWDILPTGEAAPNTSACEIGGIVTPENRVYAVAVDVIDNTGNGITAESVDLHFSTICGNSGEQLAVTGEQILQEVDTCGGGDGGDDGGCLTVAGGNPSSSPLGPALLALLVMLVTRRRRARHAQQSPPAP